MEDKVRLLSCKCEQISIFAFLLPLSYIFINYINDEIIERCKPELSFNLLKNNFPYIFYNNLTIFCILIIKSNAKGETSSSKQNRITKNYHIIIENKGRKKFLLLFFIISLIEVLQDDGDYLLYYYQKVIYETPEKRFIKGWLIEKKTDYIFFIHIFSYFILHTEIHRHHILALLLGYIWGIFVNGCRFILDFCHVEDYPYHLLNFSFFIIFSSFSLNKIFNDKIYSFISLCISFL